jgi:hypothetical protein
MSEGPSVINALAKIEGKQLTDEQLRATPVPVSGSFTTTPSGTQDVNLVSSSAEIEVTLNGEVVPVSQSGAWSVGVNNFPTVYTIPSAQVIDLKSVSATQNGAWSVSINNYPASQTVDGSVSVDNFPATQTDSLTDAELRATDVKVTLDGESVGVNNFPAEYPLPSSQVQTNALTNAEIRASDLEVNDGASQALLTTIEANQLPDNHDVTVSNQITQPTTPTDTQPVSATALPLPTGAATSAKQLLDDHNVTVSNQIAQPVQDGGSVDVGNLPATYPNQHTQGTTPTDTQPVSASSLPLPTGAATSSGQLPDGHNVTVDNFPTAQTDALTDAQLRASDVEVNDSASQALLTSIEGNQLPNNHDVTISNPLDQGTRVTDTQPISAAALPLPTGAATAANQLSDDHNVTVSNQISQPVQDGGSLDVGNLPATYPNQHAQGTQATDTQPVSAAALPLPAGAATSAGQLPDGHNVTVDNFPAAQTDALTDTQLRATAVTVNTGLTQPTTPGDTQPASVSSLPLPAGAATSVKQLADNHQVTVSNIPATQTVDGTVAVTGTQTDALTDTQLRATNVGVTDSAVLTALVNRYGGGKTPASSQLTALGLVDVVTPAAGNAIRVFWVSAINASPNVSFPVATIRIGTTVLYASSAISHWELFVGSADEKVTAQISTSGKVDVTIHYEEFTP